MTSFGFRGILLFYDHWSSFILGLRFENPLSKISDPLEYQEQ
jgi:hypothetical protein